jgi:hypothetical protein
MEASSLLASSPLTSSPLASSPLASITSRLRISSSIALKFALAILYPIKKKF